MYIALEGIPGVGKTTLAQSLAHDKNAIILPEHIFSDELLFTYLKDNPSSEESFRLNWTVKDSLVELYDYKQYIIADRCFITTLAYNFTISKLENNPSKYNETLAWCQEKLENNNLHAPDVCIILTMDYAVSNVRKNRRGSSMIWSQPEALRYAEQFYEEVLPALPNLYRKYILIDAQQSPDKIFQDIKDALLL